MGRHLNLEQLEDRVVMTFGGMHFLDLTPFIIDEGSGLTVRLWVENSNAETATIEIDLNNDTVVDFTGTVEEASSEPGSPGPDLFEKTFAWSELVAAGINDGQGTDFGAISYPIRVSLTDTASNTDEQSTDVFVSNVAPQIASLTANVIGGGGGGCGGGSSDVSLLATILEAGPNAGELGELSAVVDWGDSHVTPVTLVFVAPGQYALAAGTTHTYTTAGNYPISLTVTEADPIFDGDDDISNTTASTPPVSIVAGPGGPSVCFDAGVLTVTGSAGNDNVTITQPSGQIRVESSFFPTSDFPAGSVLSVVVLLGGGNDMLLVSANKPVVAVGGAGTDILTGGPARSILIGGEGADLLYGGSSQDILVDGRIYNDDNAAALLSLLAEWNSGHSFQDRVKNLIDGSGSVPGLNGTNYLTPLGNDGAIDILIGGGSTDWILRHAGDLNLGLFDFVT